MSDRTTQTEIDNFNEITDILPAALSASGNFKVAILEGAGGTEYADGAATATPTGTVAMGTDGSNVFALLTDVSGHLQIDVLTAPTIAVTGTFYQATQPVSGTFYQATQPVSGTVTANLGATDNAVLDTIDAVLDTINAKLVSGTDIGDVTINNASIAVTGTFYQVTQPVSATDLDIRDLSKTQDDVLIYANTVKDGSGTDYVPLVDADGHLQVDVLSGGGAGTQYTEDVATANPQVGSATMVERDDALTTVTPVEGDWIGLRGSAEGALWTQDFNSDAILADTASIDTNCGTIAGDTTSIDGKITACNTGAVVLSSGTVTTVTTLTGSGVAHDAADSGNPHKIGGRAQEPTAQPDEVADNDRVDTLHDRVGRIATYQGYPRWYAAINTATSGNNTIKAAAGAGKKIVVTSVTIISDGTVDIRWESGAGGTALSGQMPLQEREGYSASDPNGLFETAANTLLNLELSAAINCHGHISGIIIDD